ncbi:MAG: hypothetical protein O3C63_05185 [Cyanobacteria bacterium]|nr:hypothetical protein [Cyanobacteriota bacterium]MDA1021024.1 hypothetical protein [Cyanobacteriota bacterium]
MNLSNLQDNFWLRRLHSLSGIVPIGGFLMFHLFANSTALTSADNYNAVINFLRELPFVEYIEWLVLFIPIGFHAIYGIVICSTAQPNHMKRPGLENFRYILQRATGIWAMVYIYYHIMQFKTVHDLDYNYIAKTLAGTETISWLPLIPYVNPFSVYWFYVISLLSINYHFANGLWGFCITWGITIGKKSQEAISLIGVVVFAVLSYIGIATVNHLAHVGAGL